VEIWDVLTLDKCSTLQPTKIVPKDLKPIGHSPNALAYSSDGHSLAGCFGSTATIWDIQTGGVIKEIEFGVVDVLPKSLVWLLDGTTIGAIFSAGVGNWIVFICDIASVKVSTLTIQSSYEPYLWPDKSSIWMMAISENEAIIGTFEVWPATTVYPVQSYSITSSESYSIASSIINCNPPPVIHQGGFLSVNSNTILHIYNMHNQKIMLREFGFFTANCFSPSGDLFAASSKHTIHIWKLGKDRCYHQQKEFQLWEALGDTPRSCKFSPASSSLLISRDGYLEVQPLEGSITHTPEKTILIEFSTNGTYLVTALKGKSTIMFINLYTNSSKLIKINYKIHQLALAGNFLFVRGASRDLIAWRLTAEGTVDGASDVIWVGSNVSSWTDGQIGIIDGSGISICYDVETGKELKSMVYPPSSSLWKDLCLDSNAMDFSTWPSFSYHDLIESSGYPSKDNLLASIPWCQEGWLMYPEGEYQHRLWLPTHWRTKWEEAHWLNDIKMLRLVLASGKVIIKL